MRLIVKRGKLGRWRWFLQKNGKHRAMCGAWGYKTRQEAISAAMRDLSEAVKIDTEYECLFAGKRNFK